MVFDLNQRQRKAMFARKKPYTVSQGNHSYHVWAESENDALQKIFEFHNIDTTKVTDVRRGGWKPV